MIGGRAFDWSEGAVAGIVGAIVYTVFIEAVNVATNGVRIFFFPFRQIGAVALGSIALNANYNVVIAAAVGTAVHFLIGAAFGIMIAGLKRFASLRGVSLVALGSALGFAFYVFNVFVIFPVAFPWFLSNDRLTQSIGHALFGAITGIWLARRPGALQMI